MFLLYWVKHIELGKVYSQNPHVWLRQYLNVICIYLGVVYRAVVEL